MDKQTESNYAGGYIVSEASGTRSRELLTLAAEQTIKAGQVLGKVTANGQYVAMDPAAEDGSEVAAAIAYDAASTGVGETLQIVAHVRDMEFNDAELAFPDGIAAPDRAAAITELAALGMIAR